MSKNLNDWEKEYELRKLCNEESIKQARINLIKKEIEVNKMYIEELEKIKPIINKFDGKMFNAKVEKALQEIISNDLDIYARKKDYSCFIKIYTKEDFNNSKGAIAYSNIQWDNTIKDCYLKIKNKGFAFNVYSGLVKNSNGKKVINSEKIIELINNKINSLNEQINIYNDQLMLVDEMLKEFKELEKRFEEFNEKYDDRLKDLFEVNYYLESH